MFQQTIRSVHYFYPSVNIVWQLPQKRTSKSWLIFEGQPLLNEIRRCNIQPTQLVAEMNFNTIRLAILIQHMNDCLQASPYGVVMM